MSLLQNVRALLTAIRPRGLADTAASIGLALVLALLGLAVVLWTLERRPSTPQPTSTGAGPSQAAKPAGAGRRTLRTETAPATGAAQSTWGIDWGLRERGSP